MPDGARITDYTDTEILLIIEDLGDDEGWVTSKELAERLGLYRNGRKHPTQNIGSRMSWMRFFGVVEAHPKTAGTWRVSDRGIRLITTKVPTGQRRSLEGLNKDATVDLMEVLGAQFTRADAYTQAVLRRTFQHYAARGRQIRR